MGLFGRRKSEEELEDEIYEEEEELRKTKRKLKDLNPQNKRSRKEPIKPWTKADRMLVGGVFFGTVVIALILFAFSVDWKLPGLPRIGFPTFKPDEDVLTINKEDRETAQKIKDEVNIESKKLSGTYAFSYIRLDDGFSFGLNDSVKMNAASLMKIPVLIAYFKSYEKGEVNLEEQYVLANSDKQIGSGSLSGKPAGTKITYKELVYLMGKESDNTAMKIVSSKIGEEKIKAVIKEAGMINTDYSEWETTASDMAELFYKLYKGDLVSQKSKDMILDSITNTIYENVIPAGIDDNIKIAHKYGRELHIIHDAGIIFGKEPYVLAVMSKSILDKEGEVFIPQIVSLIHLGIGN